MAGSPPLGSGCMTGTKGQCLVSQGLTPVHSSYPLQFTRCRGPCGALRLYGFFRPPSGGALAERRWRSPHLLRVVRRAADPSELVGGAGPCPATDRVSLISAAAYPCSAAAVVPDLQVIGLARVWG